ncbi:unnamed protein product [Euphydryas editha]|uniref:Uncharacterized protein n=1 Tax=Euphydryas editha TaxID=104508 RepID=A0AAU9UWB1_EUPED|nr:unnamed protein product [Euphydryas editha]
MAAIISKLKSGANNSPPPLESNPILQYFELGKESSCAGPGLVWRVHDAYRKSDGKVGFELSEERSTSKTLKGYKTLIGLDMPMARSTDTLKVPNR